MGALLVTFNFTNCMSFGDKVAHVARTALEPGPMGYKIRGDYYKEFVACGTSTNLAGVKTSCAVFASACLNWAGRPFKTRMHIGQGIFRGWLEGMWAYPKTWKNQHPAWIHADEGEPVPGAVFYRAYSLRSSGRESHVGVFVERDEATGLWITAEGGGGCPPDLATKMKTADVKATNGTVCRLSQPKDVYKKDTLGRVLCGWWLPEKLNG